jgi:hypothetical protein
MQGSVFFSESEQNLAKEVDRKWKENTELFKACHVRELWPYG